MILLGSKRARHIAGQMFLTVSSSGFQAVCAVLALAMNARALGVRDFGILALVQAYAAMISSLATFESWQPVIRLGVTSRLRLGLTLSSGILLDICAAVAATTVAIGGILLFSPAVGIADGYRELAVIYSLSLLAGVAGTPKGFFRLRGRYSVLVGNQITQGLALLCASAALWFFEAGLEIYVICFASIAATYNFSLFIRMLVHMRRDGVALVNPLRSALTRRYLRQVLRMALGTSLLSTLWNMRRNLSLFLVGALIGPAATGVFAVGSKLANMVNRISGPLNQVLFPEIVKITHSSSGSDAARLTWRLSAIAAAIAVVLAAFAYLVREPIVLLAAGPGYQGAGTIFGLLFLAECIGLAGLHLNAVIQGLRGTGPLLLISTGALLLFFSLSVVLAGPVGVNGVAVASVIGAMLMYVAMLITARFELRGASRIAHENKAGSDG